MEISEFLSETSVIIGLKSVEKKDSLEELLSLLIKSGKVSGSDKASIMKSLIERESLGSTGIGQGVGIPHTKTSCAKELCAAIGITRGGVNFDALDGAKVNIIFLLLAPEGTTGPHLKALAHISRILRDKLVRERLLQAKTQEDVINILKKEDKKLVP